MTIAEKITLGVSIATALGIGALLKSAIDHFLARPEKRATIAEKEVTIADKSIQIANTLMQRMESEMERLRTTLADARKESEELRAEVADLRAANELTSFTTTASLRVLETSLDIEKMLRAAQTIQHDVDGRLKQLNLYINRGTADNGVDIIDTGTGSVYQVKSIMDRPDEGEGTVGAAPKPRR